VKIGGKSALQKQSKNTDFSIDKTVNSTLKTMNVYPSLT